MTLRQVVNRIGLYFAVLVIVSPAVLFFLWMLSLSIKFEIDNASYPPVFIPARFNWGNYAAGVSTINGLTLAHRAWILDVADGIDNKIRYVVPDGQITSRGDISHVNGNAVSYPVTLECFADVTGQKAYVYYDTALIP